MKKKAPNILTSKVVHDKKRVEEINVAMLGYLEVGREIPFEWVEELYELRKPKRGVL